MDEEERPTIEAKRLVSDSFPTRALLVRQRLNRKPHCVGGNGVWVFCQAQAYGSIFAYGRDCDPGLGPVGSGVFFREVEERTRQVVYWIQGICFTKKS